MRKLLKSSFLIMSILGITGCMQFSKVTRKSDKLIENINYQKVFTAPYDKVWRAAQLSTKYPISISNMDSGELETESIRATEGFKIPETQSETSSGMRYKIFIRLAKGKTAKKETVRVIVTKKVTKQRDFFADPEEIASDGLEEKVILYRIEREIKIEEALQKSHEKENAPASTTPPTTTKPEEEEYTVPEV